MTASRIRGRSLVKWTISVYPILGNIIEFTGLKINSAMFVHPPHPTRILATKHDTYQCSSQKKTTLVFGIYTIRRASQSSSTLSPHSQGRGTEAQTVAFHTLLGLDNHPPTSAKQSKDMSFNPMGEHERAVSEIFVGRDSVDVDGGCVLQISSPIAYISYDLNQKKHKCKCAHLCHQISWT